MENEHAHWLWNEQDIQILYLATLLAYNLT